MQQPTLETHQEEENWETGDQEDVYDAYDAYVEEPPETTHSSAGPSSKTAPPFLNLPNHSEPSLHTPDSAVSNSLSLPTPDFRSPPPEYDSAVALDFNRLRISDPNPVGRAPSPVPLQPNEPNYSHSATSQSLDSDWRQNTQPLRSMTMPVTTEHAPGWNGPPRSVSVSRPARGYDVPGISVEDRSGGDPRAAYRNGVGQASYMPPSMQPGRTYPTQGGYPPYYGPTAAPWQGPPPGQYQMPYHQPMPAPPPSMPGQQYDPLYAAASDLLGPPPGAQAPTVPMGGSSVYASPMTPPPPSFGAYQQGVGLYRGPSNAASMRSGYSGNSGNSGLSANSAYSDNSGGSGANLSRSGTTASAMTTLNTRKTKAIDANQPPFTKEYIDQYRARIKVDPDPEAHFAYAKYLIEAAKKVGAHAADQKAVRKYRDSLIGEAIKVIRKLATSGETLPDAQFFLANCYGTGMLGLQIDHEKAYSLYVQGANQHKHPASLYRAAVCNELGAGTRRDMNLAFVYYARAAKLGDTAAMYKLGMVLLTGQLGQRKDEKLAVEWLQLAADQADEETPHALHELASLYESKETEAVPHDEHRARELYAKAANLGYTKSCLKLGGCYEYGTLGCPVDPKRSIAWYTRAAEKNDPEAELALSGWYLTGSEGVLKQSDHEAYLWARKAANKGLPKAEYAVGYYAEVGIGIKPDIEFAKRWYLRAAAQGHQRSKERLTQLKIQSNKRLARPTRQQAKDECVIM